MKANLGTLGAQACVSRSQECPVESILSMAGGPEPLCPSVRNGWDRSRRHIMCGKN